jgi:hypothetical protein
MDNEEGIGDEHESYNDNIEEAPLRRLTRISQPSTRLRDFYLSQSKLSY